MSGTQSSIAVCLAAVLLFTGMTTYANDTPEQNAPYVAKQLRNFQTGARTHQIMSAMATTINDAELIDIGAYFASQKKMQGNGKGDNPVANNLFTKGDATRGIPPCMSCHGVNGKGQAPNIATYPVTAGSTKATCASSSPIGAAGNAATVRTA